MNWKEAAALGAWQSGMVSLRGAFWMEAGEVVKAEPPEGIDMGVLRRHDRDSTGRDSEGDGEIVAWWIARTDGEAILPGDGGRVLFFDTPKAALAAAAQCVKGGDDG